MLANVLGHDGGRERYSEILAHMEAGARARAEDLRPGEWLELYKKSCGI
jgi:hypothetical protein